MNLITTLIKNFYGKPLPKKFSFIAGANSFLITKVTEKAVFYKVPEGREVSISTSTNFDIDIIGVEIAKKSILHGQGLVLRVEVR